MNRAPLITSNAAHGVVKTGSKMLIYYSKLRFFHQFFLTLHPPMRLLEALVRFLKNTKGVAAVEFALILPFMLVLFFGTNEVTQAIMASRKLQNVVRVTADLAGQYTRLSVEDTQEIFKAANEVMEPYDTTKLGLAISGIEIDEKGKAKVVWSFAKNGLQPKKCGDEASVPEVLKPKLGEKGFILLGDGMYNYVPSSLFIMKSGIDLTNSTPWVARAKASIILDTPQCL